MDWNNFQKEIDKIKQFKDIELSLSNGYKLWVTKYSANKNPTLLAARPNDNNYNKVATINDIKLFREVLYGQSI